MSDKHESDALTILHRDKAAVVIVISLPQGFDAKPEFSIAANTPQAPVLAPAMLAAVLAEVSKSRRQKLPEPPDVPLTDELIRRGFKL